MPYKDPQKRKEMLDKVRPKQGRAVMHRGTSRHIALGLMKVAKGPITSSDLKELNPKLFKNHTSMVFASLCKNGYAEKFGDDSYIITELGLKALYEIPIKYPRRAD